VGKNAEKRTESALSESESSRFGRYTRRHEEVIREVHGSQKKNKKNFSLFAFDEDTRLTFDRVLRFFILRQKGRRRKKSSSQRAPLLRAHTLSFYTRIKKRRKRHHAERATANPPSVLARAHAAFERGFFAGRAEGNFTQSWISNVRFLFSFPV